MGFLIGNGEHKQRINLSKTALMTIQEDISVFSSAGRTSFINTIIANFHSSAKASCENYLQELEHEMTSLFEETDLNASAKSTAVRKLVEKERAACKKNAQEQISRKGESVLCRINNANAEWLESEECEEDKFYNQSLGLYLKCLLEEYTLLPYIKRERIYFKEFYDEIEIAIEAQLILKARRQDGKILYIRPYKLIEDPLSTRYYLACYTTKELASRDKRMASLRVSRLKEIRVLRSSGKLSQQEKQEIERALAVRSVQFLVENEDEILVYLTDVGIRKYHQQLHLRPTADSVLPDGHTYVFHCTQSQAEFYFFRFGKEARILEPLKLRDKIHTMYSEALAFYEETPSLAADNSADCK